MKSTVKNNTRKQVPSGSAAIDKTNIRTSDDTFAAVSRLWLQSIGSTIKDSSYSRYSRIIFDYILPELADKPIDSLAYTTINAFKELLLKSGGKKHHGLSAKTVSDILSVLKSVINYASLYGYKVMRTELIKNPKRISKEMAVIPDKDLNRLEEALLSQSESISFGILLAIHTGIRNGELCGLKWGDLDFERKTMKISRTVERISSLNAPADAPKTKVIISEPKTEKSRREIPLPITLCNMLEKRKKDADIYVVTGTGNPSEPHTLYIRYERFLKRNGFEKYTFHALRHTFATRSIESGFDSKSLSEILGHSDVSTTMRCYVHSSIEQKRKYMEALFDAKIRGKKYIS